MMHSRERAFVYIAYLDDSGTRDKKCKFQTMAAVIVKDASFRLLEVRTSLIAESIIPPERIEKFEEFHAWQLYGGYKIFDGIEQEKRFYVIEALLNGLKQSEVPIVCATVDKERLDRSGYGSADPVDICFRRCIEGIEKWIADSDSTELAFLVADEFSEKNIRASLKKSFRAFRQRLRTVIVPVGQAWHLHDEMYFGNSRDSVGIQLADLCAYFVAKHHRNSDTAAEGFFKIIEPSIVYSKVEPE